jgi:hypothetical protein
MAGNDPHSDDPGQSLSMRPKHIDVPALIPDASLLAAPSDGPFGGITQQR